MSASSQHDTHPLRGVRVLIVEDSWHVAKALGSVLSDLGMVVTGPTSTMVEAKRLAVDEKPELALVDLNLKGEMAFGLVDWLHRSGLRVIVLTGYAGPTPSLYKANAIVQKPFGADELVATMQDVMLAA
jgi:DNA-binding response OmpR family regulator